MTEKTWRKSSASASNDQCVEVAGTLADLRDSKAADGPELAVGRRGLAELVSAVKTGKLGR